jgi:hypothetical protein
MGLSGAALASATYILVGTVASQVASAAEWYEGVTFTQNDPLQFDSQRTVLFPKSGLHFGGNPATAKLYGILPRTTVEQMERAPNHLLVIDTHVLTAKEADSYKRIFHAQIDKGQVPWILGAIGAVPGTVTNLVGVTATLLDGVSRLNPTQKVSASALEQLMAEKGQFSLVFILNKAVDPNQRYVSSSVTYSVSVGGEQRSYVICSSTFALKME